MGFDLFGRNPLGTVLGLAMKACVVCDGAHWVCEDHPNLPWDSWHQENCGAGMPCVCTSSHQEHLSEEEKRQLKEFENRQDMFGTKKKASH